jgi:hypothetical protein
MISIGDLERRAILGPRAAVIVDARGRDVGVPKPLLHLGDVGLVIERVCGGGRPKRMRADPEAEPARVSAHELVNAVGRDRLVEPSGPVVAKRSEQRAGIVSAVAGRVEVVVDEALVPRYRGK